MDHSAENFPLTVEELMQIYSPIKPQIEARLTDFQHIWETASDEELFKELVFCLLTPQSKAKTCWKAVQRLDRKCMMTETVPARISEELVGVRFNQRKAEYVCRARSMFCERSLRATLAGFGERD
jgi:N-glycosylase/DNA lyase